MATGTFKQYLNAHVSAWHGEINWGTSVVKCMHSSATHTPDQDAHNYKDDVTNEVTGTNVVAGGFTCDTCTITVTGGTNVVKFDHDDEVIASATATGIANSHWYNSSPATDVSRPLIGYITWDAALSPNAGTLTFSVDVNGLLTITPA